jgi:hypothetical protein
MLLSFVLIFGMITMLLQTIGSLDLELDRYTSFLNHQYFVKLVDWKAMNT